MVVGFRGRNFLLEVKDWKLAPSKKKLNETQVKWHDDWKGQVAKVEDAGAALAVIGAIGLPLAGQIT